MITLHLFDVGSAVSGVAFAMLSASTFVAGRRLHASFFVASVAFALAAIPSLERGAYDALGWYGLAKFDLSPTIGVLLRVQGFVLLVAALAVMWATVGLMRQDRPNISLKRTNQSLRD